MNEKVFILYGNNHFSALRLENIFTSRGFKFLYLKNLTELKDNINLLLKNFVFIIVEIENSQKSIAMITEIKNIIPSAPLIVISDDPRRELFIEAILAGAKDFIVKPFDENILLSRISVIMKTYIDEKADYFESALEMIRIELRKSQKGKYPLGFGLITLFKPVLTYTAILEQQYRKELPEVFNSLEKSFFETDIKQLVGSQSMLVALNFCESRHISVVESKITEFYDNLIFNNKFNKYLMAQVYVSEFADECDPEEILNYLMTETKRIIAEKRGGYKDLAF